MKTLQSIKKALLSAFAITAFVYTVNAQNTFPAVGNVGIGISPASYPLHIKTNSDRGIQIEGSNAAWSGIITQSSSANGQPFYQYDNANAKSVYHYMTPAGDWRLALGTSSLTPDKLSVTNDGYVGIGTVSPSRNLEINQNNTGGGHRISWGSQYPTLYTDLGYPNAGGFILNARAGGGSWARFHFQCDGVEKFQINKSTISASVPLIANNKIGVGTSSPNQNIEINQNSIGGGQRISWGSEYPTLFTEFGYPAAGGFKINAKANGGWARIHFNLDDAEKMVISKSNVTVRGLLVASEIQVMDVGADYVFDKNYKLKSLNEVENFIKTNKHLPGIAPASETKNGIKVGEFNEKLLEKIEELTLYVIELKKQNDRLSKEVEILKLK